MITDTLLDTTASICRTLSRNESHILLAGPMGSNKIDSLYIACTFLGIKLASITPVKNYNINDFYNDLKMVGFEVSSCLLFIFLSRNLFTPFNENYEYFIRRCNLQH